MNTIYTKQELKKLKGIVPSSLFTRIKRINSFIDNNWDKYIEGCYLLKEGQTT